MRKPFVIICYYAWVLMMSEGMIILYCILWSRRTGCVYAESANSRLQPFPPPPPSPPCPPTFSSPFLFFSTRMDPSKNPLSRWIVQIRISGQSHVAWATGRRGGLDHVWFSNQISASRRRWSNLRNISRSTLRRVVRETDASGHGVIPVTHWAVELAV